MGALPKRRTTAVRSRPGWTRSDDSDPRFPAAFPCWSSRPLEAIEMWKTKDGKIVEGWHVENLLQVLIQLGAIPAPGTAPAANPDASPTA